MRFFKIAEAAKGLAAVGTSAGVTFYFQNKHVNKIEEEAKNQNKKVEWYSHAVGGTMHMSGRLVDVEPTPTFRNSR